MLNITNEEYHANKAIGSSSLRNILSSPALCRYNLDNEMKTTDAMLLGTALHACFLEPKRFEEEYELAEKKFKGELAPYLLHDAGNITPANYLKFKAMQDALKKSNEAQALLANAALIESSFFMDYGGVDIKCRPDLITKDGWIVDLKTVGGMKNNPSAPQNFNRDFFEHGYDLQMFMYKNIVEKITKKQFKGFKFICVDAKTPISGVNIYTFIDGESKWFEIGGHRFHQAIKLYKECLETNNWFVYEQIEHDDLELSYEATDYYAQIQQGIE